MTDIKHFAAFSAMLILLSNYALAETTYEPEEYQPQKHYIFPEQDVFDTTQNASTALEVTDEETAHTASTEQSSSVSATNVENEPAAVTRASSQQAEVTRTPTTAWTTQASDSGENKQLYLILFLIVVLLVWWVNKKRPKNLGSLRASINADYENSSNILTGVERYLRSSTVTKTGVEKYLAKQAQAMPSTGVAKYLAKQAANRRDVTKP